MTIIRFEVKTQSGSVLLVEDHTHLIGHPTWYLIRKNIHHRIHILIKPIPMLVLELQNWVNGNSKFPTSYLEEKKMDVNERNFMSNIIVASNSHNPNGDNIRYISSPVVEFKKME